MALSPGTRLGPYEILEPIGAGGMGEVYRARDTKLGRDVAIKVLPEEFSRDKERLARFEREAKLLAQLNHPCIATLYGLEKHDGQKFLVMELVEGEELAERIAQGPIPIDETAPLFIQIAEGLEAAHEKGIIHRDLKPANIKITPEGKPKILDFGLAKALGGEAVAQDLSQSPTLTKDATETGVLLGTAPYMSPEQARGKPVDKRTDIWAFGCCLYEALTGKAAFLGETVSDTLAKVLEREHDWSALPASLPPRLRELLSRCLQKDPKKRIRDIGDVRLEIERAMTDPTGALAPPVGGVVQAKRRAMLLWIAFVALTGIVAAVAAWNLRPARAPHPVSRFEYQFSGRGAVAVSPDGSAFVYSATDGLYLRFLNQLDARRIPGTEEFVVWYPFFSPDGQWVGFFSPSDNQLKKIATSGGAPVSLCNATMVRGAGWGVDDTIVFIEEEGIMRVPANGGTPELLVKPEEGEQVASPHVLPDGTSVLFTATASANSRGVQGCDQAQIVVQSLESGDRKVVLTGGTDARYVPTGHLVYARENVLYAVPFDITRLEVTAGPVPMVEGVRRRRVFGLRAANVPYSFSETGTLVYVKDLATEHKLAWVDRSGHKELLSAPPGLYRNPMISPDGRRVAVTVDSSENTDIWIWEVAGEKLTRLTFDAAIDEAPAWTPDGSRVVFRSGRDGGGLFWRAADGSGEVERLLPSDIDSIPLSWSPDGRQLILSVRRDGGPVGQDIALVELEGDLTLTPLLQGAWVPQVSPDGRWLAYTSYESGRGYAVNVRPFPNVEGGPWQISEESTFWASAPRWSSDGRELFYLRRTPFFSNLDTEELTEMTRVDVITEPSFSAGNREVLFRGRYRWTGTRHQYDLAPNGERFLMIDEDADDNQSPSIVVVQNWFEELKARAPVP